MNRITIGRSNTNDIILPDPSVSRQHAELRSDGRGRYFLIDLDSTNGTYVRDGGAWVRIRQGFVAADERVQFGELVTTLGTLLGNGAATAEDEHAGEPEPRDDAIDETPPPSLALPDERREPSFRGDRDCMAGQDAEPREAMRGNTADPSPPRRRWVPWALGVTAMLIVGAAVAIYFWLQPRQTVTAEAAAPPPPTSGTTWQLSFGGADLERAHDLAVLADGTLAVAGSTTREGGPQSTAPWLLAVTPEGTERWSTVPQGASGRPQAAAALSDGGLIAAGSVQRGAMASPDGWAARLDADGAVVWTEDFGGDAAQAFNDVVALADGGAVLAGSTRVDASGDGWLVAIDGDGRVAWEKTVGGAGGQAFYALAPTGDGGFLAAGVDDHDSAGAEDGWLVRFDAEGEVRWQATAGGERADYLVAVQPLPDGGAVAVGRSASGEGAREDFDLWVVWVDAEGTVTLERRMGGDGYDAGTAVALAAEGRLLVAGVHSATEGQAEDGWLLKLDASNGSKVWERTFGGDASDRLAAVAALEDGSIAVAGQTASGDAVGDDLWLMRLDAEGEF